MAFPFYFFPIRTSLRILAQISLVFTCFLPLIAFMGHSVGIIFKHGVSWPEPIDAAAFIAAALGSAALIATLRKRSRERFSNALVLIALTAAILLFFANVSELWFCQISDQEDYECYWIAEALAWSTSIMIGLLMLKYGVGKPPASAK